MVTGRGDGSRARELGHDEQGYRCSDNNGEREADKSAEVGSRPWFRPSFRYQGRIERARHTVPIGNHPFIRGRWPRGRGWGGCGFPNKLLDS